jgi:hypothetical protein
MVTDALEEDVLPCTLCTIVLGFIKSNIGVFGCY